MQVFCLQIKPEISIDDAWEELEKSGVQLLYSCEDLYNNKEIYCLLPKDQPSILASHSMFSAIRPADLIEPDWNEQWKIHGLNFHDGHVHVSLKDYGYLSTGLSSEPIIKLEPGPGFGNLSHPTTMLVLKLMSNQLLGKAFLDVGCGSGILALCAQAMGASMSVGIDIDLGAVLHAKKNARLNGMENAVHFFESKDYMPPQDSSPIVLAMNMISSEQINAWKAIKKYNLPIDTCLTSGVLEEERATYLKQVSKWGWTLKNEIQEGEWLGFHFQIL